MVDTGEDVFLGLVGAVGANLKYFAEVISNQLLAYDYMTEVIQLTDIFPGLFPNRNDYGQSEFKRIHDYMEMGNTLRNKSQKNEILAMHAIAKISGLRKNEKYSNIKRRAFIFKSLKHPDEVKLLRKVYGDGFYLLGLHNTMEKKHSYLTTVKSISKLDTETLIDRDQNEEISYGQKLRDSYQLADIFINGSDHEKMCEESKRFIEILFGCPYHTPTPQEHNMFQAYTASLRSSDLSRQVGAVIANKYGDIIAQGFNDVPKAQGGLYNTNDKWDKRDFQIGHDSNREHKNEIVDKIIDSMKNKSSNLNLSKTQTKDLKPYLSKGIEDITEYGRSVHAEMEALLSAARVGVSIRGGTLYTTTFPCHNCTKHIVASGIVKIIYIEPYPKSLAKKLHEDSISIDKDKSQYVSFLPFLGVGPRRYFDLFSLKLSSGREVKRKDRDGKTIDFESKKKSIQLRLSEKDSTYIKAEKEITKVFNKKIKKLR